MSLFYQYACVFADLKGIQSKRESSAPQTVQNWYQKVNSWLPRRKKDELKECQRNDVDFIYSSLLYAVHLEASWWIELNISEFSRRRRLILPQMEAEAWKSPMVWKIYWREVRQRVLPPLMKFQATYFFGQFFYKFVRTFATKETMLRLNQHPPRRAITIAERESDRLLLGMEVFVVSIWANVIFFAANYTVGQICALYDFYSRRRQSRVRGFQRDGMEDLAALANQSWKLLNLNIGRLCYSGIGAGIGSIFWPGWGTLLGIGLGDEWARKQQDAELPRQVLRIIQNGASSIVSFLSNLQLPRAINRRFSSRSNKDLEKHSLHEEIICGCCQTTVFSSNPNCRECAPISSRVCGHTICKSCVEKCHLAYMERTSSYQEWVKCPLCNAERAFSPQDLLVNRSLCSAIAAIERNQETLLEAARESEGYYEVVSSTL